MEQYIRDKYERKLFMSPEMAASLSARSPILPSAGVASVGGSIGHANSPAAAAAMRYPLQMKSLQEMGFTEVTANQAALLATAGNLQQAIEALLSGRTGKLHVSPPPAARDARETGAPPRGEAADSAFQKKSVVDDLADIFGAPPPPPPAPAAVARSSQSGPASATASSSHYPSASILDMDLPAPGQEEEPLSDEYEAFESAVSARDSDRRTSAEEVAGPASVLDESRPSQPMAGATNGTGPAEPAATKARQSIVDTGLGPNPWATSTDSTSIGRGAGEAFDDIDPFRGYLPPATSRKQ